jgi:ankyrin repeat protein
MVEKLIQNGANIDVKINYENEEEPILLTSLRYNYTDISLEILKYLIKNPLSSINNYPYEDDNILIKAVIYDEPEVVDHLLKNGADVNKITDSYEENLLMNAKSHEMAKLLIEKGININYQDSRDRNALLHFVSDDYIDIFKLLLENNINYKVEDVLDRAQSTTNAENIKKIIKSY